MSKRYEEDIVVFCAVDSDGKIFYKNEIPARRYHHVRSGITEWRTKGRGNLKLDVYAPRDLVMKGIFASTKNLSVSLPQWGGMLIDTCCKDRTLKKLDGIHIEYKSKTIMRMS